MKKDINLLSPNILTIDLESSFQGEMVTTPLYFDNKLGINIPVIVNVIEFGKVIDGDVKPINFDVLNLINEDVAQFMYILSSKIGYCGNTLAQSILNQLKNINAIFKTDGACFPIINSIIDKIGDKEKTNEQKEKIFKKLDFMKNRDIFSTIINKKVYPWLNNIIEEYDDSLTATFMNFITDRNKYVHGIIYYWASKKITLLKYESTEGEYVFAELNKDILNSFIKCYEDLDELLKRIEAEARERVK